MTDPMWGSAPVEVPCEQRRRIARLVPTLSVSLCAFRDGAAWKGLVLWAHLRTKQSVALLEKWPDRPTFVISHGKVKRTAIWALREAASAGEVEAANRRLAYALRATQADGDPDRFFLAPGECVAYEPLVYDRLELLAGLKEPPARKVAA